MGMYTELILGCSLKKDTPESVIKNVEYCFGQLEQKPENLELDVYLNFTSQYFAVSNSVVKIYKDKYRNEYVISARVNLKNYNNEIESFLDWLWSYISSGSGENEIYAIVIGEHSKQPKIYSLFGNEDD